MHRFYHAAFAPKRWNGAETALGLRLLLPNANCGEKKIESGEKREGQSGFRKQDIFFFFFFCLKVQMTKISIYSNKGFSSLKNDLFVFQLA